MKIHDWRIEIMDAYRNHVGYITPAGRTTREGITYTLDPHGSCLEASWSGRNMELSPGRWIQKRDLIHIQVKEAPGDPWKSVWFGYLIMVPNRYSSTSQEFRAYGLKRRNQDFFADSTWLQFQASEKIRLIMVFRASDTQILIDDEKFTGGLTVPITSQRYQSDYELLDAVASAGGVVWGVDVEGYGFAHEPSTASMEVTEGTAGTRIEWQPVNGLDLVSRVIYVWKVTSTSSLGYFVADSAPLIAAFGVVCRVVWLDDDAPTLASSTAVFEAALEAAAEKTFFAVQTETPAAIGVAGLLAPEPHVDITRPDSSVITVPVTEVQYVISKARNGQTTIKAGARLPPEEQIVQSLIRELDTKAQNAAIRNTKGVV